MRKPTINVADVSPEGQLQMIEEMWDISASNQEAFHSSMRSARN
jgi:hypothetical protein